MIAVRREQPQDVPAVRLINERAFGQPQEANIVDKLRAACPGLLSLVAEQEGQVVGHILFSPTTIEGPHGVLKGMGLAPVAVMPECQRQGVGSQLIRAGIAALKETGCPFIILLGHPEYHPRFGFERASRYGIRPQWEGIPDEAFMILWFDPAAGQGVSEVGLYRSEFNEAM